jgi:ElaB/YqjD/DUF883 family membrane-anchored ribosome-binding protein
METEALAGEKTQGTTDDRQRTKTERGSGEIQTVIANEMEKVAEFVGRKASDQETDSSISEIGKQAAGWLDQSADYVRQFEYDRAEADIREYVKKSPGRSLLIAGGIGLVIGVIMRRR